MPIVLGIAAVVLLFALVTKGKDKAGQTTARGALPPKAPPAALPPFVRKVLVQRGATRDDLQRAAELSEKAGYTKLTTALNARISTAKQLIPSPWKDVTSAAWTTFVRTTANSRPPSAVSPRGLFGMFQIPVRRLVDLGVMKDPRSKMEPGPAGKPMRIWEGTWIVPEEKFLADPKLQYEVFLRSMELYRSIIAEKYKQVLGMAIEGDKPASLSGLLALSHTAGVGIHKWLVGGNIRKKFHWVTEAYQKANGIF